MCNVARTHVTITIEVCRKCYIGAVAAGNCGDRARLTKMIAYHDTETGQASQCYNVVILHENTRSIMSRSEHQSGITVTARSTVAPGRVCAVFMHNALYHCPMAAADRTHRAIVIQVSVGDAAGMAGRGEFLCGVWEDLAIAGREVVCSYSTVVARDNDLPSTLFEGYAVGYRGDVGGGHIIPYSAGAWVHRVDEDRVIGNIAHSQPGVVGIECHRVPWSA